MTERTLCLPPSFPLIVRMFWARAADHELGGDRAEGPDGGQRGQGGAQARPQGRQRSSESALLAKATESQQPFVAANYDHAEPY
eukprot:scaffold306715_cov38-Prasinocladus_malaysianus.AAC.1